MSKDYDIGDELTVKVEKIVPNGFGLAFAENLTIFVPLSATGDQVRIRLSQIKGKTAFAEIVEVIKASPDRIDSPCPYFGSCGGCNFQQLNYRAQLDAKVSFIKDCFTRIGKIEYEKPIEIIASPAEFGYRSRAQWHVDTKEKTVGYYKRGSHDVINIEHCPIASPQLNAVLAELRSTIEWDSFWGNRIEIEAAHGDDDEVSVYSKELVEPTQTIRFTANGFTYFYTAQSFFQANHFLIEKLVDTAIAGAAGGTALDLYCGVGLFALPLSRSFRQVVGVEGSENAIEFAKRNAEHAKLPNVTFVREGVGDFLGGRMPDNIDFVLLDPPRAGTEKNAIYRVLKLKPKAISYVSCEPSVLARDLRKLLAAGYEIEAVTAFDLFPQTHHVETVVRLTR